MKSIITFCICLILVGCGSQQTTTNSVTVEESAKSELPEPPATPKTPSKVVAKEKKKMLVSTVTKEEFMEAPFSEWFMPRYKEYEVDKDITSQIAKTINNYKITVFMGTWCGDSKRETPQLYRILEAAKYDMSKLKVIAVDRKKTTPKNLQEGFNIIKVPTIIFTKNGKEVNRFVEYARETLAEDILKIVSGQEYKHSYAE